MNGVEIAKSATTAAVSVTGYVAGKVGSATKALGKFLAPHIQRQGSNLLTSAAGSHRSFFFGLKGQSYFGFFFFLSDGWSFEYNIRSI